MCICCSYFSFVSEPKKKNAKYAPKAPITNRLNVYVIYIHSLDLCIEKNSESLFCSFNSLKNNEKSRDDFKPITTLNNTNKEETATIANLLPLKVFI